MTQLRISAAVLACAVLTLATTASEAKQNLKPKEVMQSGAHRGSPSVAKPRPIKATSAGAPSFSDEVSARRQHRYRHHRRGGHVSHGSANLITISTAGGSITVAAGHADKFRGFIADIVARGYRGPINCYARGGHVRGSLHYRGEACDFAQRGWNRTHRLMYRVADLAAKHGLRDGCSFGDCGHIDTGARLARGPGRRLVAQERAPPVWPVVLHH